MAKRINIKSGKVDCEKLKVGASSNRYERVEITSGATGDSAPSHIAPTGSLFINTSSTSAAKRLYINTDGSTTWKSFTAAA